MPLVSSFKSDLLMQSYLSQMKGTILILIWK